MCCLILSKLWLLDTVMQFNFRLLLPRPLLLLPLGNFGQLSLPFG
jgi:hypothetical protein